jgi:hypothetical protein
MTVTERVHRSDRPTKREWPPIPVLVGIATLIGAVILMAALEPAVQPTLTVEPSGWGDALFWAALTVGTILGVRIAWNLLLFFSALVLVVAVLGSAISDPRTQTIGGAVLIIASLVLLLFPSVRRYETKRIRVIIE